MMGWGKSSGLRMEACRGALCMSGQDNAYMLKVLPLAAATAAAIAAATAAAETSCVACPCPLAV
jgi:hypothetical protein